MNYRDYTSIDDWFSLKLPHNWSEYEDEEGTAAFFNSENWSGNLRITPLRLADVELDKNPTRGDSEMVDNPDAVSIKLGDWNTTFYSKESSDGCIIYYWKMGSTNFWFMCSFTIDKEFFNTDRNTQELTVVEEILGSIKILD